MGSEEYRVGSEYKIIHIRKDSKVLRADLVGMSGRVPVMQIRYWEKERRFTCVGGENIDDFAVFDQIKAILAMLCQNGE